MKKDDVIKLSDGQTATIVTGDESTSLTNCYIVRLENEDISDYDKLELQYLIVINKIDTNKKASLEEDIKEKYSNRLDSDSILIMDLIKQIEKGGEKMVNVNKLKAKMV